MEEVGPDIVLACTWYILVINSALRIPKKPRQSYNQNLISFLQLCILTISTQL